MSTSSTHISSCIEYHFSGGRDDSGLTFASFVRMSRIKKKGKEIPDLLFDP